MLRAKHAVGFLCATVLVMVVGCGPKTLAEQRQADSDYWMSVGGKFTSAEADLVSAAAAY